MHDKFQGCTVVVQAATLILNNQQQTLHYVHTPNVCHDAQHDVSVIDRKFQAVRVNTFAHALTYNNQYLTLL